VAVTGLLLATTLSHGAEVLLLQESFETADTGFLAVPGEPPGLGPQHTYIIIAGGDDAAGDYFARRQVGSPGTKAEGGTLHGEWMWAAEDIDNAPGPRGNEFTDQNLLNTQGRLIFPNINVAGMGNLRLVMAAATGNGGNEPQDDLYIRVRFDGGEWVEIGGFKSSTSEARPIYYTGPKDTLTKFTDTNQLFRFFFDYDWEIVGKGAVMDMDITMASNASDDEFYLDNIRIYGDADVRFFDVAFQDAQVVEPVTGGIANPLSITLAQPAPAGGVTFSLDGSFETLTSLQLPAAPVFIAEGQTQVVAPLQVIQDGRFTGTKVVDLYLRAPGYNTELARTRVENVTPLPARLMITEAMNVVPGTNIAHTYGDANGDGVYHNTKDQFMEIVNFGDEPVDLTGWTVGDDLADRHIFPEGTILYPNTAVVIFGGGPIRGIFGGAIVQPTTAGGNGLGFNITSRGEIAYLKAPFGVLVDLVEMPMVRADMLAVTNTLPDDHPGKGVSASVHRTVYEKGELGFILNSPYIHSMLEGSEGRLFSPGTKPDGTPWYVPENEITLTVDNPVISEGAGSNAATATITLSDPAPAGGLHVTLETDGVTVRGNSFYPKEITLDSLTVTVPEGQTTATFRIGGYDDGILDGDRIVTIYARSGPYVLPGFIEMIVEDIEVNDLDVVINEVLSDVTGTAMDFNRDGRFEDLLGDQYIELVNNSGRPVNMSGWTLSWDSGATYAIITEVHTFLPGTFVPAGGAIVVFGAVSEAAAGNPAFGGAVVQGARERDGNIKKNGVALSVTSSYFLQLRNQYGFLVDEVQIVISLANQDQAVNRDPDITGTQFVLHLDAHLLAGGMMFLKGSPGMMVDGFAFPGSGQFLTPNVFTRASEQVYGTWLQDPVFGLLGLPKLHGYDIPWIYSHNHAAFWYVRQVAGGFWAYDMALGSWIYSNYTIYPWVWKFPAGGPGVWVNRHDQ
jgi:hypothetical protein